MKILFLTNNPITQPLINFLKKSNNVILWEKELTLDDVYEKDYDFYISYNYRFIIPEIVVNFCYAKLINLHISYLPYNRGSDPLFWSIVDKTPCGVTIHEINAGLDTGPILVQKLVELDKEDTLKTGYEKMHKEIQELFISFWHLIRKKQIKAVP
jgi:dTDP-4-amino-4,6-dideoxyglucose formyltransferase